MTESEIFERSIADQLTWIDRAATRAQARRGREVLAGMLVWRACRVHLATLSAGDLAPARRAVLRWVDRGEHAYALRFLAAEARTLRQAPMMASVKWRAVNGCFNG